MQRGPSAALHQCRSGCGTHAQLLREGGLYKRIYDLQLKDQEEVASLETVPMVGD